MGKMLAAVFHKKGESGGEIILEQVDIPEIKKNDDVLIEIKACGICGTDLKIMEGAHPANDNVILGHEFCGIVENIGEDVKDLRKGDKVVVDPNLKCGICPACRRGYDNQCEFLATGQTFGIFQNGGFTKYCVIPRRALYQLPIDIDFTKAALIEPLSCAVHCHNIADVKECDNVVILGAGPMGLIIESVIRKHPINQLFVVEPMEFRRKKALELGANYVINPETDNVEKEIKKLTNNHGADVIIDAVGKSSTFEIAQKIWASRGRLILFGQDSRAVGTIKPNDIVRWQRSILGSYISSGVDYLDAISLIKNNTIDTEKLISHKIPLENLLSEGMKIMKEKTGLKIIVIP